MLLVVLTAQVSNAQDSEECIIENYNPANFIVTPAQIAAAANELPVVFNVAFWQVNDSSGYYPDPISENHVLTVIANMNIAFNDIGIYFKYRGLNELNSPANVVNRQWIDSDGDGDSECTTLPSNDPDGFMILSRCQLGAFGTYVDNNNLKVENSFNVYIPAGTSGFGGSSGGSRLTFNRSGVTGSGMIHEFAHSFGLHHTHGAGQDNISWRHPTDPTRCEHVTRDQNITPTVDPVNYFNAYDKGDFEYDTASAPNYIVEYCHFNGLPDNDCSGTSNLTYYYVDENDCNYTGGVINTDCAGREYDIFDSDVRNYMSYSRNSCKDSFTPNQIAKMQGRVTSSAFLANLQADISSLYEPYKGEYYFAGPDVTQSPLFQPGFDYRFVRCGDNYPQPTEYNDLSFNYSINSVVASYSINDITSTPYEYLIHPNRSAIVIDQLNTSLGYTNVQRCYDNNNKAPLGGSITKFNDNTFNNNVTITQKDSIGINQETLVDELPSGLYKIEKQYDGGSIEQTIILKGNNE
ncbi:MAG: hypothetical protein ACSHW7_04465 [Patiriisocius sp.]|uniref:hypothetical protein n=1 Tax=Patiriisocius sp. TaxID=2822396 RepID=UPI003EF5CBCF